MGTYIEPCADAKIWICFHPTHDPPPTFYMYPHPRLLSLGQPCMDSKLWICIRSTEINRCGYPQICRALRMQSHWLRMPIKCTMPLLRCVGTRTNGNKLATNKLRLGIRFLMIRDLRLGHRLLIAVGQTTQPVSGWSLIRLLKRLYDKVTSMTQEVPSSLMFLCYLARSDWICSLSGKGAGILQKASALCSAVELCSP